MDEVGLHEVIREQDGVPVRYLSEVVTAYSSVEYTLVLKVDQALPETLRLLDARDEPLERWEALTHSVKPHYGRWGLTLGAEVEGLGYWWEDSRYQKDEFRNIRNVARYEYIDKTDGVRCIGQVVLFGKKTEE